MMNLRDTNFQNLITSLLLNGNFIQNPGLVHGKTGIAIFFYHLSRESGTHAFEYFADEMIDEISSNLTNKMPVDFENGLSGIGWGIEYLVQNHFFSADTDDILEELDNCIFSEFLKNTPEKIDLLNGILGIGYYFLMRVKGTNHKRINIINDINKNALIQICKYISMVFTDIGYLFVEPQKQNIQGTINQIIDDKEQDPYFDLTWNLPALIGFLAEVYKLEILKPTTDKLLIKILTSLNGTTNLPLLQCNRLLLRMSLLYLKNAFQYTFENIRDGSTASEMKKIGWLTNVIINKLTFPVDDHKYTHEINILNLSLRYGLPGIALINKKLYESTNDPQYLVEFNNLIIRLQTNSSDSQFRYDYSIRGKTNEQKLGVFEGISGLLLIALCGSNL